VQRHFGPRDGVSRADFGGKKRLVLGCELQTSNGPDVHVILGGDEGRGVMRIF